MAKVPNFHTIAPVYGGERNVYHDQGECSAGKRIKPEYRRPGTVRSSQVRHLRGHRAVVRTVFRDSSLGRHTLGRSSA
jgi:hypothetical protein